MASSQGLCLDGGSAGIRKHGSYSDTAESVLSRIKLTSPPARQAPLATLPSQIPPPGWTKWAYICAEILLLSRATGNPCSIPTFKVGSSSCHCLETVRHQTTPDCLVAATSSWPAHLRGKLPAPPLRVPPVKASQEALRLHARGHDLHADVAAKVLHHDAAPSGHMLKAQHARTAGQEVARIVEGMEACRAEHGRVLEGGQRLVGANMLVA